MNEAVTKRFLLYFRLMMLVWILIANAFFHVIEFDYSWLVFLSNIMLFTMEGDIKDRFLSVELGGLVGMVLTVLAMLAIAALTPVLGGLPGLLLPLAGAVHPHYPAPLCPQGAQQRRLCLPHGGLHRRGGLCGQPAPVLLRVHRRLPRLQRDLHPSDEARESLGRQNRKSMTPLQKRCLGIAFVLPGPVVQ